jgi:wyosine [tRNA(Phe)-imidazoG37] synthetase (radical SAM superfamily)
LQELSKKGQRTVYRLTLVKGYNAAEIDNYARLVELGQPDFIEIKGVTFCGSSKGQEERDHPHTTLTPPTQHPHTTRTPPAHHPHTI